MLSRIAESLYWLGRHLERAEDTARLIDVHYHLLLEDRWAQETATCKVLLDVMGVEPALVDGEPDAAAVTGVLAHDVRYPGSITRSMDAAWDNARGAREVISSEMWETINATHLALRGHIAGAAGAGRHEFFGWIKDRVAAISGLVDSTMSRDEGWRFFVLGRSLERADMTARLLSTHYGETWGPSGWTTTLRLCAAHEAYLRTYRRAVEPAAALEFLLLDRLFPRSIFHALHTAERCLGEIDPRAGRSGIDDEARRQIGRMCAELQFLRVSDVADDLAAWLTRVQDQIGEVHARLARRYFRETRVLEWSV